MFMSPVIVPLSMLNMPFTKGCIADKANWYKCMFTSIPVSFAEG